MAGTKPVRSDRSSTGWSIPCGQPGGLFSGRSEMARFCQTTQTQALTGTTAGNTDFRINTTAVQLSAALPYQSGRLQFLFVRVYDGASGPALENAGRGIRFITPDYKELFRIPDGDKVRITWSDGERIEHTCRYIDDCHLELGRAWTASGICQLGAAPAKRRHGHSAALVPAGAVLQPPAQHGRDHPC